MSLTQTITLNNGVKMPQLGLGVWKAAPAETIQAVKWALAAGYRHIDTAWIYGNETEVGQALRESDVNREDVFVTTKLWRDRHGDPEPAFQESLYRLGLEYVDLYLSHFPAKDTRIPAYKSLEKILASGRAKAIGVSNYTIRHLQELLHQTDVVPAVNQVEIHPFLAQPELVAFCHERQIRIEAYSPLAHAKRLEDPTLVELAQKYQKSPAQVMIRWCVQQGFVVIPKSVKQHRIVENSQVFDFEIASADMQRLDQLDCDFRTCWDPTDAP